MRAPPRLRPQQAVQTLDIQGQTYQIPLALDRVQAAQPELAKAQDAFDPADGRFHLLQVPFIKDNPKIHEF